MLRLVTLLGDLPPPPTHPLGSLPAAQGSGMRAGRTRQREQVLKLLVRMKGIRVAQKNWKMLSHKAYIYFPKCKNRTPSLTRSLSDKRKKQLKLGLPQRTLFERSSYIQVRGCRRNRPAGSESYGMSQTLTCTRIPENAVKMSILILQV